MTRNSSRLFAAAAIFAAANAASAQFVLVDDFESYALGDFPSQAAYADNGWNTIASDGSSSIEIILGSNQPFSSGPFGDTQVLWADDSSGANPALRFAKTIDSAAQIAGDGSGTFFYQFATRGDGADDSSIGLDDSNDAQFPFSFLNDHDSSFDVRGEADGGNQGETIGALQGNTVYNVWNVVDNEADTFSVYLQSDGDSNFATQTLLQNSNGDTVFTFINAQHTTGAALSRVVFQSTNQPLSAIDNIYIDPTGENLDNPLDVVPSLPGDANGDGVVDLADFGILRSEFGSTGGMLQADFNDDMLVDLADFGILRANFGSSADVAALDAWHASIVPEPTSLALIGLASFGLMRRRRA